ncbi:MAG TPA: lysylphosphatidylglycerol synthase domain-containing protein [Pyrinomonadaceae bacterium]|nr:lysylphosphatidylglycerol synthase domain-containing protein [Pyrinomonadaceae bacterium]
MSEQTRGAEEGKSAPGRFAPAGVLFAVCGLLLFAYYVWKAGPQSIWENITQLGAGFAVVLLISAVRPFVRAAAWTRCFEDGTRLRIRDAFKAYLAGDALGSLTPLGMVVSEPAKAAFVRDRVPIVSAISAIAVENLFYMLSVALFIFAGTAALLLSFTLNSKLRLASYVTLAVVAVVVSLGALMVRRQWRFLSGALEGLQARGLGRRIGAERRARLVAIEDRIYGFYARHRSRFLPILALEACFHLAGVAEVYATLYFILDAPPPFTQLALAAFVLESVNRVINVIFKFVPMRVGVDEAGTGLITKVLKFGTAVGVTLAIIRKARVIVWTAIGLAVLVRRGLSLRSMAREAQEATAAAARAAAGADSATTTNGSAQRQKASAAGDASENGGGGSVIKEEELIAPR